MPRQSRSTWQRAERHVARSLNSKRNGNTGRATADVATDAWCIEVKSWQRLPARVLAALRQAEQAATGEQTALAVLHAVGARHDDDLVCLRWRDFAALLIGVNPSDARIAARMSGLVALAGDVEGGDLRTLAPDGQP